MAKLSTTIWLICIVEARNNIFLPQLQVDERKINKYFDKTVCSAHNVYKP